MSRITQPSWIAILSLWVSAAYADHTVLLQGGGKLAKVKPDGSIAWHMPWGGIHDIHVLPDGNILTRRGRSTVVEIDPSTKQTVWSYDRQRPTGTKARP